MNNIIESGLITASDSDILAGGRLSSAPANGIMIIELISSLADATNNFVATVQLPDNSTPLNNVLVPGSNPALAGVMDERQKLLFSSPVTQGGSVKISVTETGTAVLMYRVSFRSR